MPIIMDLTLDPDAKLSGKKLQSNIDNSLENINEVIENELGRRGYYIIPTRLKESDLSLSDEYDIIVKNALNQFRRLTPHKYDNIQYTLPQAIDKMIKKHDGGSDFHIDTIHNVLFVQVESHIAKSQVLVGSPSDAHLRIRMELVNIRQAEIIAYKQQSIKKKSVFNLVETRHLLTNLLSHIPLNIHAGSTSMKPKKEAAPAKARKSLFGKSKPEKPKPEPEVTPPAANAPKPSAPAIKPPSKPSLPPPVSTKEKE